MPNTVGTSTITSATQEPFARKSFYANGRFWVFYSNGTNAVFRTSTDGLTWSDAVSVGACAVGYDIAVVFDGIFLHYARIRTNDLFYRRGTPLSDGTVDWSAVEQLAYDGGTTDSLRYASITVDSGGCAWVGARVYIGTAYVPKIFKNANNDGTWSPANGFPVQFSSVDATSWRVTPIPLTGGKVYVIYARSTVAGLGKLWDGSEWGSEETTMSDCELGYGHSAVAQGDDVHLVFLHDTLSTGIRYNKRTFGVGWGTESTVQASADSAMTPILSIDPSTGNLYCFYSTKTTNTPPDHVANHIYYKIYESGAWGSAVDWIDESTDVLTGNDRLTCFYQAYGNYVGLVYTTKTSSQFNVRFDYLEVAAEGELHERSIIGNTNLSSSMIRVFSGGRPLDVVANLSASLSRWGWFRRKLEKPD